MPTQRVQAVDRDLFDESWVEPAVGTSERPRLHHAPDARRCVFVITDHGDRTQTTISRALYVGASAGAGAQAGSRGILGHGVKVTQAVFWSGWPGFDYLDDPGFHGLMREVADEGIEVCLHNTSEHMDLPPLKVRENIRRHAGLFSLKTWIDHYRLPSNLSQQGMQPESDYYILDLLQEVGVRAAWSFRDVFVNPVNDGIDLLTPPPGTDYLASFGRKLLKLPGDAATRRQLRSSLGEILRRAIGRDALGNLVVLRQPLRDEVMARRLANAALIPINVARHWLDQLGSGPPRTFPVRHDATTGLFWFDSVRVTEVSQCYNERSLDDLIQRNGIHIGHTYLGFESRRYPDSAFLRHGDLVLIRPAFEAFLGRLSYEVQHGVVWNPTMRDLIDYWSRLRQVALRRDGSSGWTIVNGSNEPIRGVTLCHGGPLRAVDAGAATCQRVGGEYWCTIDLDGHQECTLRPG